MSLDRRWVLATSLVDVSKKQDGRVCVRGGGCARLWCCSAVVGDCGGESGDAGKERLERAWARQGLRLAR